MTFHFARWVDVSILVQFLGKLNYLISSSRLFLFKVTLTVTWLYKLKLHYQKGNYLSTNWPSRFMVKLYLSYLTCLGSWYHHRRLTLDCQLYIKTFSIHLCSFLVLHSRPHYDRKSIVWYIVTKLSRLWLIFFLYFNNSFPDLSS